MPNKNPRTPNRAILKDYLNTWKTLENYTLQEESLNLLFNDFCPSNKVIEHILLKVSALNDFYSTNIFDTYSVAKHILQCNIDQELSSGNGQLVNVIAPVKIKHRTINFYSFASKYCSHHKPESYPIYDSYVVKMLMFFKKKDKYDTFRKADLKDYTRFMQAIKKFQEYYNLNSFTLRQIDIYLWLAGKEHFPNRY